MVKPALKNNLFRYYHWVVFNFYFYEDLEALLKETINGQAVLSYYKSNHCLSEGMRTKLGDVIISDHLKKDIYKK